MSILLAGCDPVLAGCFNFTSLALACPPDRSFVTELGGCSCRPGWWIRAADRGNGAACQPCAAGRYSDSPDASSCARCPLGTHSRAPGSAWCDPCVGNTYTPSSGAAACLPCPPGAECLSDPGVVRALPGWWMSSVLPLASSSTPVELYECPEEFCCPHGGSANYSSSSLSSFNGVVGCSRTDDASRCAPNREGFLCGECKGGFSSFGSRGACVECDEPNLALLLILAAVAVVFILLVLLQTPSEDASFKLLVDYVQMGALILNPRVGVRDILQWIHADFGDSATDRFDVCLVPDMHPLVSISVAGIFVVLLLALLELLHLIHWFVSHPRLCCGLIPSESERGRGMYLFFERHKWRYVHARHQVLWVGFMALLAAAVQLVDCRSVAGEEVVTLAPTVACFRGDHYVLAITVLCALFLVVCVGPLVLLVFLRGVDRRMSRRSRGFLQSVKQVRRMKEEYERQKQALKIAVAAAAAVSAAPSASPGLTSLSGPSSSSRPLPTTNPPSPSFLYGSLFTRDPSQHVSALPTPLARQAELDAKILALDAYLAKQMEAPGAGGGGGVQRTGHEAALWCYRENKYWCEPLFVLRRSFFVFVVVLLPRADASLLVAWGCLLLLVLHARSPPLWRKKSSAFFHDVCVGAIAVQAAFNVYVFRRDPGPQGGALDLSTPASRALVGVVYAIALLPVLAGVGMWGKEIWKERVREGVAGRVRRMGGEEAAAAAAGRQQQQQLQPQQRQQHQPGEEGKHAAPRDEEHGGSLPRLQLRPQSSSSRLAAPAYNPRMSPSAPAVPGGGFGNIFGGEREYVEEARRLERFVTPPGSPRTPRIASTHARTMPASSVSPSIGTVSGSGVQPVLFRFGSKRGRTSQPGSPNSSIAPMSSPATGLSPLSTYSYANRAAGRNPLSPPMPLGGTTRSGSSPTRRPIDLNAVLADLGGGEGSASSTMEPTAATAAVPADSFQSFGSPAAHPGSSTRTRDGSGPASARGLPALNRSGSTGTGGSASAARARPRFKLHV